MVLIVLVGVLAGIAPAAYAQPPRELYTQALGRDRAVRDARQKSTLRQIRSAVAAYERVVRKYPASGYADNALWQASELSRLAWDRFNDDADRKTGLRLLKQLQSGYPSSSLLQGVEEALAKFDTAKAVPTSGTSAPIVASAPKPVATSRETTRETTKPAEISETGPAGVVTLRGITRSPLPDGVRISIEMDRELLFKQEQLDNPRRVFFDIRGAYLSPGLRDKTLTYTDDIVREIRLGRHPQNTTRVVMDTENVESYSVFTLYNPYRVIVDFRRKGLPTATATVPANCGKPACCRGSSDGRCPSGRTQTGSASPARAVSAGCDGTVASTAAIASGGSADASRADRAARKLERSVFAGAAARIGCVAHRARPWPRRPRSRRAR